MPSRHALPLLLSCLAAASAPAATLLDADGSSDSYALISSRLSSSAVEVPDCSHPDFGPHITQQDDPVLGQPVFLFHLHVTPDNDRCLASDRQRNEIKVDAKSPDSLRIFMGDSIGYRWRFRLDAGFQASPDFTHLHQIRAYDGDEAQPILTLTARTGTPDKLELIHTDSRGLRRVLHSVPLQPLRGEWVEAYSRLTAGSDGRYTLTLTRLRDGATLLSYSDPAIDLWRDGATFLRPKWGIYRSLASAADLRDETVAYAGFCLAKGESDDCPSALQAALPAFTPGPGSYTQVQTVAIASATPGASLRYSTDDSTPDCSGNGSAYSGPLTLYQDLTLRAIACRDGLAASPVAAGRYRFSLTPVRLPVAAAAVTASSSSRRYPPERTVDRRLNTRWQAEGDGQWIQYDLQASRLLSRLTVAWYRGDTARFGFDIQVSSDGDTFTTVYSGQSNGQSNRGESYDFAIVPARYLRIVGHGNSSNDWTAISETEIYGQP